MKIYCPECGSERYKKNGFLEKDKQTLQKWCCRECVKVFVWPPKIENKAYILDQLIRSGSYLRSTVQALADPLDIAEQVQLEHLAKRFSAAHRAESRSDYGPVTE